MRFGIVGCGLVAQVMHIPYLAELARAELYAFADPDPDKRGALADRYNVDREFENHETMIESVGGELDAVVVLTPSHTHADVVVDVLGSDIDTLVEKPIAASPADAHRMVDAEETSDATAMVGYMKRYDPAYERVAGAIDRLDSIDLITAYDVDPDHRRIIDEVYDIVEGDTPPEQSSDGARQADIEAAIGTGDELLVDAYDFQVEHVCHDINVLRGLFGAVKSIDHVDVFADGRYATAQLTYEGDIQCILETGDSDRKWFEEFVRIDSPDGMVKVDFSNPFIKNTPTELRRKQGIAELVESVETPSYAEPFKRELQHFIDCVAGNNEVRTTLSEARDDLQLIVDLFRTYQGESPRKND